MQKTKKTNKQTKPKMQTKKTKKHSNWLEDHWQNKNKLELLSCGYMPLPTGQVAVYMH